MHVSPVRRVRGLSWSAAVAIGALLVLALAACSSDDGGDDGGSADEPDVERPDGPVADLSEELTGGDGIFIASGVTGATLDGYEAHEYVAAGTASSYQVVGEQTPDGEWTLEEDATADYRTRVIVQTPEDPDDFSGTVLVEWLNVSGGIDADTGVLMMSDEIAREGHAWVGVSAQIIGVEGGDVLVPVDTAGSELQGLGLKNMDPERYGTLAHPGDGFAFDIYTQVARALREGAGLDGLEPADIAAMGQSQSASAMVTYINGVQPLTSAFDGFFVHSRGAGGLPIAEPGGSAGIADTLGLDAVILRTDTEVPIFVLQTENDVVGLFSGYLARQDDTDTFRAWEVPGTAHADQFLVGADTLESTDCGFPINDGPMNVVAKAAMRQFTDWVAGGEAPPSIEWIAVSEDGVIERDEDGIAIGGVRTPPVDVPTRILSGEVGPGESPICLLSGVTRPMTDERIAVLYPSRADFDEQYEAAVEAAIEAGVVLAEEREAIEGYAHGELVG